MNKLLFLPPEEGFLGVNTDCAIENLDAIVVPFGLENSVSYGNGTRIGPRSVIKASHQVELFDEEYFVQTSDLVNIGTIKEPQIEPSTQGALNQIESITKDILDYNKFPLIIGGEHSITVGAVRPFLKKYGKDLVILHFDAHADLRDTYKNDRYSHACAMRRVVDLGVSNILSVGIRNISKEEVKYLQQNKNRVNVFWAKDKDKWDYNDICNFLKDKNVYISFDVDVFDSSVMPSTGTPEPGGLIWNEVIKIISLVGKNSKVVGADIVELSPIKQLHSCDFLVAKLCYKVIACGFVQKLQESKYV